MDALYALRSCHAVSCAFKTPDLYWRRKRMMRKFEPTRFIARAALKLQS
jgi:hypothetical protein